MAAHGLLAPDTTRGLGLLPRAWGHDCRCPTRAWYRLKAGRCRALEKDRHSQSPIQGVEPHAPALSTSDIKIVAMPFNLHPFRSWYKRLLKELSSLPRAIGLMAVIFCLGGIGTIIPQNKGFQFYLEHYPDHGEKVLGFLSYHWVLGLQLDHIYTAWYFYASLLVMAASLMACTSTRQLPALKFAQNWRFMNSPSSFAKLTKAEVLPRARLIDLGRLLKAKDFQVFLAERKLYAFKGLAGRFGPIGVHLALLLILGGTAYSTIGGLKGSVMCPEGQDFVVGDSMYSASRFAAQPEALKSYVHVNKFDIDYRPDGQVAQFYSDLSLHDFDGREIHHKLVSVNDPFRYGGVTMYQTDWSLAAVTLSIVRADSASESPVALNLPFASLEGRPGIQGRMWATFLPIAAASSDGQAPRGVSVLARDPQSVIFYDGEGKFVGVRRPGSGRPITVDGVQFIAESITGSTGLEMKSDPAVPWIYTGYAGLMITTMFSCMSHCQVWALQQDDNVYVSGKTNKAAILFDRELSDILNGVPEATHMHT